MYDAFGLVSSSKEADLKSDNAIASLEASTQEEGPSLYTSIYDPSLDIKEALDIGFTTMTLIAANSRSSVNLGLVYRQKPNGVFDYDYGGSRYPNSSDTLTNTLFLDLGATSVPNLSLVCDAERNGSCPYFFTLVIQMPNFNRLILQRRQEIAWLV